MKRDYLTSDGQACLDLVKQDLCLQIQRVAMREQWTQRVLAARLGTTSSTISLVCNSRVESLSLSQLFRYLAIAYPRFKVLIAI